jgi:hypothetical protein
MQRDAACRAALHLLGSSFGVARLPFPRHAGEALSRRACGLAASAALYTVWEAPARKVAAAASALVARLCLLSVPVPVPVPVRCMLMLRICVLCLLSLSRLLFHARDGGTALAGAAAV